MAAQNKKSSFGTMLVTFRKERGLTQHQLAKLAGISQRMIAYYESQEEVNPPMDVIAAIAKALNIKFDDLLGNPDSSEHQSELAQIDSRTLGKLKMILSLPKSERHIIYTLAEAFIAKRKLDLIDEKKTEPQDPELK